MLKFGEFTIPWAPSNCAQAQQQEPLAEVLVTSGVPLACFSPCWRKNRVFVLGHALVIPSFLSLTCALLTRPVTCLVDGRLLDAALSVDKVRDGERPGARLWFLNQQSPWDLLKLK